MNQDELNSPTIKSCIRELDISIRDKIAVANNDISDPPVELQDEDDELNSHFDPMEPDADRPEADEFTPEALDNLISAEVILPQGDVLVHARVIGRKRDELGNPIGVANSNPILDTQVYDVQFPDGKMETYAANVRAENIYSQLDNEGNRFLLLEEIMDHRRDGSAVHADNKYITHNGRKILRQTTRGWEFLIRWRDGSTSWEALRNVKNSNPFQLAEYVISNKLSDEAACRWWVPHMLKKRDRIITAVKTRVKKKQQKFGLEIPTSVHRALQIDLKTGTDLWRNAIDKEMKHVMCAFDILEDGAQGPKMSKRIPCHMIFDIKMDFTRKAHFVAGGHVTNLPSSLTYSSVVVQDSVRLAFLIAALNDLEISGGDIGNAYLQAPTKEKVHTICGPEFGHHLQGRFAIICRALHELKSSRAAWHSSIDHLLQLVTKKAFSDLLMSEGALKACHNLVNYFNSSSRAMKKLLGKQVVGRAVKPDQDVTTRWWSTYTMCERLLRLKL